MTTTPGARRSGLPELPAPGPPDAIATGNVARIRAVTPTVDPAGLLNPGKLPTVAWGPGPADRVPHRGLGQRNVRSSNCTVES